MLSSLLQIILVTPLLAGTITVFGQSGSLNETDLIELDPKIEIERMIIEQERAIDAAAGFSTQIRKTTKATGADPSFGIRINLDEIQTYASIASVKNVRQYLTFILAHEKAHHILFRQDPRSVSPASAEEFRLYECQADILAAKYMIEGQGQPTQLDLNTISEVLNVAYLIGNEGLGEGSHPTREQRRTAVRAGMIAGLAVMMSRQPASTKLLEKITSQMGTISFNPGEDLLPWSNRAARKITHYGRSASRQILLVKGWDIRWENISQGPSRGQWAIYKYTYKNIGNRPVRIDFDFECILVPHNDPSDTFRWKKRSQKNYRFELRGGEEYSIEGQLPCGALDNTPDSDLSGVDMQFIAPGRSNFALATYEYLDSGNVSSPQKTREEPAALAEKPTHIGTITSDLLRLAISTLARSALQKFENNLVGPGVEYDDFTDYPSDAVVPGAASTRIVIHKDEPPRLLVELVNTKDSALAVKVFDDFKRSLEKAYPDKGFSESKTDEKNTEGAGLYFFPKDTHVKVTLRRTQFKTGYTYSTVKLSISP